MARAWLINGRGIAGKVKCGSHFSENQIKDCGAYLQCPNCAYHIDNSNVSLEWPGLPAGVKFEPSDAELLEHLAGKVGLGNSTPHFFIDEFIPTLDGSEGICCSHPENLPGAKKDGNSVHFFYKTSKAYATGERKRRKIHGQASSSEDNVRWHKTGKTKPVMVNGVHKGCKKIMVLYKTSKKGSKPDKFNWVMHQYHLGTNEDEKEGDFVVSKIFYQQPMKQTDKCEGDMAIEEPVVPTHASPTTPNTFTPNPPRLGTEEDEKEGEFGASDMFYQQLIEQSNNYEVDLAIEEPVVATYASPTTPRTYTPYPPRLGKRPLLVENRDVYSSPKQDAEFILEEDTVCWEGESQAVEEVPDPNTMTALFCTQPAKLMLEAAQCPTAAVCLEDGKAKGVCWKGESPAVVEVPDPNATNSLLCTEVGVDGCHISDLADIDDLTFLSQESFSGWFDQP